MTVRLLATLADGLLDPTSAVLHADDLGATRGDGCFEGCRVITSAAGVSVVDKLDAHLARLQRSALALDIAFDSDAWQALISTALAAWHEPGEAAMRLLLTRGRASGGPPTGLLQINDLPPDYPRQRHDGIRVISLSRGTSADAFADAPWLLGGVKTLSYAVNMAAQREAARRGADDVIFVSTDGRVLESPTSSIVWSSGPVLHTIPTGTNGILGGTTQARLFDRAEATGWRVRSVDAGVEDLHRADALWLVGSVRGPVEVIDLDGRPRRRDAQLDGQIRRLAGF